MSTSPASHAIARLNADSFGAAVQRGTVLVEFAEPWCGPCRIQLPILERIAERVGDCAAVAVVNVDAALALAAHFNVEAIPTLVLLKNGQVVRTFVGVHSQATLTKAVLTVAGTQVVDSPPAASAHSRRSSLGIKLVNFAAGWLCGARALLLGF